MYINRPPQPRVAHLDLSRARRAREISILIGPRGLLYRSRNPPARSDAFCENRFFGPSGAPSLRGAWAPEWARTDSHPAIATRCAHFIFLFIFYISLSNCAGKETLEKGRNKGGEGILRCSKKREARGPGAEPLAARFPPGCLTRALSLGEKRRRGRQPGGLHARKKSNVLCKSTRRARPFLLLKFPRRAMLARQVMAILSWRLFCAPRFFFQKHAQKRNWARLGCAIA